MPELERLQAEIDELRQENEALRAEMDELRFEADLDACHAVGLSAQLRAIIAEGDACPNKAAHALLERAAFINDRTGEPMTKTRSYPLYREAFDAEAAECGIADPAKYRG
ncbi:hypothetical protein [Magnetospirillum sulfuroxidans]|uniref:Uncharacterized protein n=1 Tax=Magnetospirillum sulfuroxidans TaxID=611300 RepID=A0ABS5IGX2_9PROT|nr:hypothetical protein [Magnetospirillum sulfuroxidans]MBR9973644.1 hypothetical protein [Magnetospirillum sulfuroxidans]